MPLKNDAEKEWEGWLVDGLGGQAQEFHKVLTSALTGKSIPQSTIKSGVVNMWWRKDSLYIDITSNLDGSITSTIHIQPYGTSLWIGRAVESSRQWNYYKRMAAGAFIKTVDRCIRETVLTLVDESALHIVSDLGKAE